VLAGADQNVGVSVGLSVIEPGAGAPLHYHDDVDEVLVILDGLIDFELGGERREVGANHTVVIPAKVPHRFTVIGTVPARIIGFLPQLGVFAKANYVEGVPPEGAKLGA